MQSCGDASSHRSGRPQYILGSEAQHVVPRFTRSVEPVLISYVLCPVGAVLFTVVLHDESPCFADEIESSDPSALIEHIALEREVVI